MTKEGAIMTDIEQILSYELVIKEILAPCNSIALCSFKYINLSWKNGKKVLPVHLAKFRLARTRYLVLALDSSRSSANKFSPSHLLSDKLPLFTIFDFAERDWMVLSGTGSAAFLVKSLSAWYHFYWVVDIIACLIQTFVTPTLDWGDWAVAAPGCPALWEATGLHHTQAPHPGGHTYF